jgi:hypothetical protein
VVLHELLPAGPSRSIRRCGQHRQRCGSAEEERRRVPRQRRPTAPVRVVLQPWRAADLRDDRLTLPRRPLPAGVHDTFLATATTPGRSGAAGRRGVAVSRCSGAGMLTASRCHPGRSSARRADLRRPGRRERLQYFSGRSAPRRSGRTMAARPVVLMARRSAARCTSRAGRRRRSAHVALRITPWTWPRAR